MERGLRHRGESHSRKSKGSGKAGSGAPDLGSVRFGVSCGSGLGDGGDRVSAEQRRRGKGMQIIPRSFARCLLIKGGDVK